MNLLLPSATTVDRFAASERVKVDADHGQARLVEEATAVDPMAALQYE